MIDGESWAPVEMECSFFIEHKSIRFETRFKHKHAKWKNNSNEKLSHGRESKKQDHGQVEIRETLNKTINEL